MASTPENKVKRKCVDIITHHGGWYFFPAQNGYGRAGIPDIVGCFEGHFFAVECKAGYNKPTPLQEREITAIHKAKGAAMVIREDTTHLLDEWFREKQWK